MTFVKVSPKYNKDDVDKITKLWQSSLWNNHIQAERLDNIINLLLFYILTNLLKNSSSYLNL